RESIDNQLLGRIEEWKLRPTVVEWHESPQDRGSDVGWRGRRTRRERTGDGRGAGWGLGMTEQVDGGGQTVLDAEEGGRGQGVIDGGDIGEVEGLDSGTERVPGDRGGCGPRTCGLGGRNRHQEPAAAVGIDLQSGVSRKNAER